jgi:hypothetical protein
LQTLYVLPKVWHGSKLYKDSLLDFHAQCRCRCCLLVPLQLGVAKVLRTLVVVALSAAAMTINLPPLSAALPLWEWIKELLG